jgi:hypothetical protein
VAWSRPGNGRKCPRSLKLTGQLRTTNKPASARPMRSINQSPTSRPRNLPSALICANMLPSQFSSEKMRPLSYATCCTIDIHFVLVKASD